MHQDPCASGLTPQAMYYVPKPDCEWQDVDEGVDLKHTQEKHSEVLKGLRKEIPEQPQVGSLVGDTKAGRTTTTTTTTTNV